LGEVADKILIKQLFIRFELRSEQKSKDEKITSKKKDFRWFEMNLMDEIFKEGRVEKNLRFFCIEKMLKIKNIKKK
jgi:hypothetical protein